MQWDVRKAPPRTGFAGLLHGLRGAAAACGMAAALPGLLAGPAAAQETIKVGVPMILSGAGEVFGRPILVGAQMYADELNAAGGVLGRKIELIPADTTSDAAKAAEVTRDLIANKKADFIIGTFTSAQGITVSDVSKELKTIFLAAGPKTDQMTAPGKLHPYLFRVAANTTTEARSAAALIARWGGKRIATIAGDMAYGRDGVKAFVARIKELVPDAEIVDQQWPKLNETNYEPFLAAQMAAKPDAVFAVVCCGDFPAFGRQAKAQGYFTQLGNNFVGVGEAISIESRQGLGMDFPAGIWGNAYDIESWDGDAWVNGDVHEKYFAKLAAYTKQPVPSSWASQGYIGMQLLAGAIAKAGTTDTDAVIKALEGLEVQTPAGAMVMRAKDHQLNRGQVWGQAKLEPGKTYLSVDKPEYIDPTNFMD